jgi:hypothetical protein
MTLISMILFLFISAISIIQLCIIKEFFSKMLLFFYFITNFTTFMLSYFLFSNKISFIISMIFPLIILNTVLVLLFIKAKIKSEEKW